MMLQKKTKKYNPNWLQIFNHPYRILIIGNSGSGKINTLFSLISHQPYNDKIHLHAKGPCQAKYQLLFNKRESAKLKYYKHSKAFIEYSYDVVDI